MKKIIEEFNEKCKTHQLDNVKKENGITYILFNHTLEYNKGPLKYFDQICDDRIFVIKGNNKEIKFRYVINIKRASWIGIKGLGNLSFGKDRELVDEYFKPILNKRFPSSKGYKKSIVKA